MVRGLSHAQLRPLSYTFSHVITHCNFKLFLIVPLLIARQLTRPAFLALGFTLILAKIMPNLNVEISSINSSRYLFAKGSKQGDESSP
jgi:hypothetical protein